MGMPRTAFEKKERKHRGDSLFGKKRKKLRKRNTIGKSGYFLILRKLG